MSATQIKLERETMYKYRNLCNEYEQREHILKNDIKSLELELASTKKMLDEAKVKISELNCQLVESYGEQGDLKVIIDEANAKIALPGFEKSIFEWARLEKELNEAKEVIGFYANEKHWDDRILLHLSDESVTTYHGHCGGKRARSFLAKHEKKEGV